MIAREAIVKNNVGSLRARDKTGVFTTSPFVDTAVSSGVGVEYKQSCSENGRFRGKLYVNSLQLLMLLSGRHLGYFRQSTLYFNNTLIAIHS
jgi:hypothetical protein